MFFPVVFSSLFLSAAVFSSPLYIATWERAVYKAELTEFDKEGCEIGKDTKKWLSLNRPDDDIGIPLSFTFCEEKSVNYIENCPPLMVCATFIVGPGSEDPCVTEYVAFEAGERGRRLEVTDLRYRICGEQTKFSHNWKVKLIEPTGEERLFGGDPLLVNPDKSLPN